MPAPSLDTPTEALRPLIEAPAEAAIFCDVDGTLAAIVKRAEDASVPEKTSILLGALGRKYNCVACISGRSAAEARRLVGVGAIAYAGSHGAELLDPGETRAKVAPAFESWTGRVRHFAQHFDDVEMRRLRVRLEDKGAIVAFHWRGVPDEDAARTRLEGVAQEAEAEGLSIHWGRKVLEVRPPVPFNKGMAVRDLVARHSVRTALFGGDDATDLDAFTALEELRHDGKLDAIARVGVRSPEGPPEIVERADLVVDGIAGFRDVLTVLAEA
jgi:trehalose 6-phosphate phosphatase